MAEGNQGFLIPSAFHPAGAGRRAILPEGLGCWAVYILCRCKRPVSEKNIRRGFPLKKMAELLPKIIFFIWLLAITVASLIDYSSISGLNLPKGMGTGFWLHVIGYFIAGLLFILAFRKKGQTYLLIALTVLFLLGVIFEILQLRIPKRTFNPVDIAANGLGLIVFYVCYRLSANSFHKELKD